MYLVATMLEREDKHAQLHRELGGTALLRSTVFTLPLLFWPQSSQTCMQGGHIQEMLQTEASFELGFEIRNYIVFYNMAFHTYKEFLHIS